MGWEGWGWARGCGSRRWQRGRREENFLWILGRMVKVAEKESEANTGEWKRSFFTMMSHCLDLDLVLKFGPSPLQNNEFVWHLFFFNVQLCVCACGNKGVNEIHVHVQVHIYIYIYHIHSHTNFSTTPSDGYYYLEYQCIQYYTHTFTHIDDWLMMLLLHNDVIYKL